MKVHCSACTPTESACIVQWDDSELLYVIPRWHNPHGETMRESRENWTRMLCPVTPYNAIDDLRDWAFQEDLG